MSALTLIVPAYNEADRIGLTLEILGPYLSGPDRLFDALLVLDGSTDDTSRVASDFIASLPDGSGLRMLELPSNVGKGAAIRKGVEASNTAYIGYTDADLPFGVEPILEALKCLEESPSISLVCGDRNSPLSRTQAKPSILRTIAGKAYSILVNRLLDIRLSDTQCGLKVFRGKVANEILSRTTLPGFGFDVEVIHIARRARLTIKTIPVTLERQDGTRVRIFRDSLTMFGDLFRIQRRARLGQYDIPAFELAPPHLQQ